MEEAIISNDYSKSYTEVCEILKVIPKYELEKIPQEEIEFFEKNKDENYKYSYDYANPKTLRKTDAIIIHLYQKYIANDSEKNEIEKRLKQNDVENENKKREKYPVNVFAKKECLLDVANIPVVKYEEKSVIEHKDSFWKNILKKIKNIF